MGGALRAIESGYVQREIQDVAYAYQQAVEHGDQIIVGVNKFTTHEDTPISLLRVDPAIEQQQRARLKELREKRDASKASEMLTRIEQAARGTEPLMPLFIEAVEQEVTLGEICNVLRGIHGEYRPAAWA
jgi:methylmalonyl-CoA mutase N-terminal domain/subunit